MSYFWEQPDWPNFSYSLKEIEPLLYQFAIETGEISGILKTLPQDVQEASLLDIMLSEAIKTSEIEGEFLSRQDVMSSIRNNLGLNEVHDPVRDAKAGGVGQLMVQVRKYYSEPLSVNMLWEWHILLLGHTHRIRVGQWRKGEAPMQIISGSIGKEKVHFEAPPSQSVPAEMERFIKWFNDTAPNGADPIHSAPVRAAIAHLYFETIHPFEDGNGRIGRVIAEKALSQTLGRPVMMSLSRTIEADRKSYYAGLEKAQRSHEISDWIQYFAEIVLSAQQDSKQQIDFTLKKTQLFDIHKTQLNERQTTVLQKMLEAGPVGFEGGMSAQKYIAITKTSKATATRDLQDLVVLGIFRADGGGRSVRYWVVI